jgi:hypothetical protein
MDTIAVVAAIAATLLTMELLFFGFCFRWLAAGKKQREKDFARLDSERNELLMLQDALKSDMVETKILAENTLQKLRMLGTESHQEWVEMRAGVDCAAREFQEASKIILDENVATITRQKLALEKLVRTSIERERVLVDRLHDVERVLKILDRNVPVEQVLKDIQAEKYAEARNMLNQGVDPSHISRKLALSLNEVSLLSHVR